jgi:hypothetical protein
MRSIKARDLFFGNIFHRQRSTSGEKNARKFREASRSDLRSPLSSYYVLVVRCGSGSLTCRLVRSLLSRLLTDVEKVYIE